ncbi:hypothetical protein IGI04_040824 [Brassica rapa subsp. trilocularis]|uniref:Uncharacterized protein n=1 Tax=Brassica rapa subsp. trilocularis TaxID=1813537 RepID=A0ABQ7KT38_BRACM|nr:hypothetical protein IGI04_040824 [Brassica rapa subsp. trilocularis]
MNRTPPNLRHHSLMQDYQELHMDTESMRHKLQSMRERKAILMGEVRFLRRRYRQLRQDQPVMHPPDVKKGRGRWKSKTQVSSPNKRSEAETKHVTLPDLNHSVNETKTSLEKRVPLFDLNQISGEEEEEREAMNNEKMLVQESSSCTRKSSTEMKLSSCRNGGNGSNKRKVSWQDPVAAAALRV